MKRVDWVFIGILLLFFGRLLNAESQKSSTFDEVYYLLQGTVYWQAHPLIPITQHPPLANALIGIPINLLTDPQIPISHPKWESSHKAQIFLWETNAPISPKIEWAGRYAIIAIALLTVALLYRWAVQLTHQTTAGILAVLFATHDPNILANGFLATIDLPLTFFFLLAAYCYWLYWKNSSPRQYLIAGISLGLLCSVKLTALVFIVALIVMSFYQLVTTRNWRWQAWLNSSLKIVGWLMIAGILYTIIYQFNWGVLIHDWTQQRQHMQDGHSSFLLGENKIGGWWYYFPLVFAIKTPIPILLLLFISLILIFWRFNFNWEVVWLPLISIGLMSATMLSTINLGYRNLLPIIPLLYLTIIQVLHVKNNQHIKIILMLGLVGSIWISWQTHPHYLAYFNALAGGANNGWQIVVDSNIDWGQDVQTLAKYIEQEKPNPMYITWLGNKPIENFGVQAKILPGWPWTYKTEAYSAFYAPQPPPGQYAISATQLQGTYLANHDQYDYFRNRDPAGKFGYSIFLYEVKPEGDAVNTALSGIEVNDIQPSDFARWETNDVRWRWFDGREALVLPAGERAGLLTGSGHIPTHPFLAQFYQTPTWHGTNHDGSKSYAFYPVQNDYAPQLSQKWWFTEMPAVKSKDWQAQTPIPPETMPQFAQTLSLQGYQYLSSENSVEIITLWQVEQPFEQPLQSFVHLIDTNGDIVAQTDRWQVASSGLQVGDQIIQLHSISFSDGMIAGDYGVQLGLYERETLTRLPLILNGVERANRILLQPISLPSP